MKLNADKCHMVLNTKEQTNFSRKRFLAQKISVLKTFAKKHQESSVHLQDWHYT